jgi:hypothetical protein
MTDDDEAKLDESGAFAFKPLLEEGLEPPPEEFANPSGLSRGECDTDAGAAADPECDLEITAEVDDLVLEETMPGYGIEGFEGEEVGGG